MPLRGRALPANPGAGYAERRLRAQQEIQALLDKEDDERFQNPLKGPAPDTSAVKDFRNPFRPQGQELEDSGAPPIAKEPIGGDKLLPYRGRGQRDRKKWTEAAEAGGQPGLHENIGRIAKDIFQRDPVTGGWPSAPGLAQIPGDIGRMARSTGEGLKEAVAAGVASTPTGSKETLAPAWSVMHSVAGGTSPRDRAISTLPPEEQQKFKLWKPGGDINPEYLSRAVRGTETVPPVGWTPERHGMDPASYLLNVAGESVGRVAGFIGGAASFAPAFIAEQLGNVYKAATGYDIQDVFNYAHDSWLASGAGDVHGGDITMASAPSAADVERARKRLAARRELAAMMPGVREAKKKEGWESLKRNSIDLALFIPHTVKAFIDDPLGSGATKMGDLIASYGMGKHAVQKVGQGAGMVEQVARERRMGREQRDIVERAGRGEPPIAERPVGGEKLFPTPADRDIEIADLEKALEGRKRKLRQQDAGGAPLREPGSGKIAGVDPRTVERAFPDDPMPKRYVRSPEEARQLEADREAWVERNRDRLEELRRTGRHSGEDPTSRKMREQLARLVGLDMDDAPKKGEVDLYHVLSARELGEFRATGELPKSPRPMTTTDPAIAAQMAREAGSGHFVVWMRANRANTLRSGFREQKGRPGVYWVRRKTRPQAVDSEHVRAFRGELWRETFKATPEFESVVGRKGKLERAAGATRRALEGAAEAPVVRITLKAAHDIARRNRYFDRVLTASESWAKETLGPRFDQFRIERTIGGFKRAADQAGYNRRNRDNAELEELVVNAQKEAPHEFERVLDIMWAKDQTKWSDLSPATQALLNWWKSKSEQARMELLESGQLNVTSEWMRRYQPLRAARIGMARELSLQARRMLERQSKPILDWYKRVSGETRTLYQKGRQKGRMTTAGEAVEAWEARQEARKIAGEIVAPLTESELQRQWPLHHDAKWYRDQMVSGYLAEAESKGVPVKDRTTLEQFHLSALLHELVARDWARRTNRTIAEFFSNIYGATAGWTHVEGQTGRTLYQGKIRIRPEDTGYYSRLESVLETVTSSALRVPNERATVTPEALEKALEKAASESAKEGGETFSKHELEVTAVPEFLRSFKKGRELIEEAERAAEEYFRELDAGGEDSSHELRITLLNELLEGFRASSRFLDPEGGRHYKVGLQTATREGVPLDAERISRLSKTLTVAMLYTETFGDSWAGTSRSPVKLRFVEDPSVPRGFRAEMLPPEGPSLALLRHWVAKNRPKIDDYYITNDRNLSELEFAERARLGRRAYESLITAAEWLEKNPGHEHQTRDHTPDYPSHIEAEVVREMFSGETRIPDNLLHGWQALTESVGYNNLTSGHLGFYVRGIYSQTNRDVLTPDIIKPLLVSGIRRFIHQRATSAGGGDDVRGRLYGLLHVKSNLSTLGGETMRGLEALYRGSTVAPRAAAERIVGFFIDKLIEYYESEQRVVEEKSRAFPAVEGGPTVPQGAEEAMRIDRASSPYGEYEGQPLPGMGGSRGFTMAGGTNYRVRVGRYRRAEGASAYLARALEEALSKGDKGADWLLKDLYQASESNTAEVARYRELVRAAREKFDSGHWQGSGQDIFQHVRTTIRSTKDGHTLLFTEEIQADPLQAQGGNQPFVTHERAKEIEDRYKASVGSTKGFAQQVADDVLRSLGELGVDEAQGGSDHVASRIADHVRDLGRRVDNSDYYIGLVEAVTNMLEFEVVRRSTLLEQAATGQAVPTGPLYFNSPNLIERLAKLSREEAESSSDKYRKEAMAEMGDRYSSALAKARLVEQEFSNSRSAREGFWNGRQTFPWDKSRIYEDLQVARLLSEAHQSGVPGVAWLPGAMQAYRNSHLAKAVSNIRFRRPSLAELQEGANPASWVVYSIDTRDGSEARFEPGGEYSHGVDLDKLARMIETKGSTLGAPTAFARAGEVAKAESKRVSGLWGDESERDPIRRLQEFEDELRAKGELPEPRTEAVGVRPEPTPVQALAKMREGFLAKGKPWTPEFEAKQRATYERKTGKSWAELEGEPQPKPARLAAEEEAWAKDSGDNAIKLFWLRRQAAAYEPLARDATMDRSASYRIAEHILGQLAEREKAEGSYAATSGEPNSFSVSVGADEITFFGGAGSKDYMDKQIANRMLQIAKRTLLENGAPREAVESVHIKMVDVDWTPSTLLARGTSGPVRSGLRRVRNMTHDFSIETLRRLASAGHPDASNLVAALEEAGYASTGDWWRARGRQVARGEITDTSWMDDSIIASAVTMGIATEMSMQHITTGEGNRPPGRRFVSVPSVVWGNDLTPFLRRVPLMQRNRGRYGRAGGVKGAVEFLNDGRAVQRMLAATDVTTLVHEGAHIWRRFLAPDLLKRAEEIYGVRDGVWTIPQEEAFATNFERYMMMGQSPNRELAPVFRRFAGWLGAIYHESYADGHLGKVTPAVRKLFSEMLGVDPAGEGVGPQGHEPFSLPWGSTFGAQMKAARDRFNMTVEEAAARTGLDPDFINKVEKGEAEIIDADLAKLATTYGLDADSVIEEKYRPKPKWSPPTSGSTSTSPEWMRADLEKRPQSLREGEAEGRPDSPPPTLKDEHLRGYEQVIGKPIAEWDRSDWDWVWSDFETFGGPEGIKPDAKRVESGDLTPTELGQYENLFGRRMEEWTDDHWRQVDEEFARKKVDEQFGPEGDGSKYPPALVVGESIAPTRAGGRADYQSLLARLRDARVEAGLTQAEVSARLGKPQSYVSKIESGARRLDALELDAVAKVYGKDVGWFINPPDSPGTLLQGGQPSREMQLALSAPQGSAIRELMLETAKLADELRAMGREAPLYFPFIRQVRPADFLMNWAYLRRPKNPRLKHSTGSLLATNGYVKDIRRVFSAWNVSQLRQRAFLQVLRDIMADPSIPKRVWKKGEELKPGEALLPVDFISRAIMAQRAMEAGLATALDSVGLADEAVASTLRSALGTSEYQRVALAVEKGRVMVVPDYVTRALRHEYSAVPKWVRLAIDKPTSWWVAAVLYLRPAWLANNILSSSLVNLVAGVGPVEYWQALQEQFRARTPEDFKFNTAAFQFDAQQPKMGSAGETQLGQLYQWLEASPPGVLLGNLATAGKNANSQIESLMRRALYVREAKRIARANYLKRTSDYFFRAYDQLREIDAMTPGQVERAVRDVLYWHNDYSNLMPFERHIIRRVIPFYSFMRWQVQLLSTMPFKHPLRYALLRAASNAYQQAHEEDEQRLPEYMRGKGLVYTGAKVTMGDREFDVWLSTQGWNPFIVGGFSETGDVKDLGDLEKLIANQSGPIPQYVVSALTRRGRGDISYSEPGTFESGGHYFRMKEDMVGYRGKALREYPDQGIVEVQAPIPNPIEHYVGSFPQVTLARNLINPKAGYSAAPFSLESSKGPNSATERTRLTEVLRYFGGGSFVLVDPNKAQAWPLSRSTMRAIIRRKAEEEARNRRK